MRMKSFVLGAVIFFASFSVFSQSTTENGIDLYRSGDYKKAIEVLTSVTASNKKDEIAWIYLGASLLKIGESKDATNAFNKGKTQDKYTVPGDDEPVRIIKKSFARYTGLARQNNTTGTVKLAVEFRSDGSVGFIHVVQALRDGLTEQSIAAARSITFTPALKKGQPVSTIKIVEYSFHLF